MIGIDNLNDYYSVARSATVLSRFASGRRPIFDHSYVQSNLVGHLNILKIARYWSMGHLVYASSSSVYDWNKELPFRVSNRVDHPVSLYAATKRADELMSEAYTHLYRLP